MGSETNHEPLNSTPTPKANKYPHVPVVNGTVKFYVVATGNSGDEFVPQLSATIKNGEVVLSNTSFTSVNADDNVVAINGKVAAKFGPNTEDKVYLTLGDYRADKSVPISDIYGALCQ